MSDLVHFEFPPPRSWEQFEELCADLFEVMWSDPGLIRHGRAGQTQNGVDIVASRGSISPVGLQCKKKARWPVKRLTFAEVEAETVAAEKFANPSLREFYVLTTALGDERLERQVREFNEARNREKKFPISVLCWPEIVRRVARYDRVARKHFPLGGGEENFSPLLATWFVREGKLELSGEEWSLAVSELGEDYNEWPNGHVVVRQRETDILVNNLQLMHGKSTAQRKQKLELRRELRRSRDKEKRVEETIRLMYTQALAKVYMLEIYPLEAPEIIQSIVEFDLKTDLHNAGDHKIRIRPPFPERLAGPLSKASVAEMDIPLDMPSEEFALIRNTEKEFPKKYHGNQMAQTVSELPALVRNRLAIPAILRRVDRIMREDRKTIDELAFAGYFDFYLWNYTH